MDESQSDSSDDDVSLQKKALDVQIPENFDPNSVPKTGEEYLHHVIYERTKRCKQFVTAQGDFKKYNENQNVHIYEEINIKKPLDKFYPTKEWQDRALKDFTQLKNFVKNTEKEVPKISKSENFLEIIEKSPPTFSLITAYHQSSKINMLEDITGYLDNFDTKSGISETLGTWIYAILASIEKPLTPDCHYKLREFARKCGNIRAGFDEDVNEKISVPLNLYLCIIARYFNQLDLQDPDISNS